MYVLIEPCLLVTAPLTRKSISENHHYENWIFVHCGVHKIAIVVNIGYSCIVVLNDTIACVINECDGNEVYNNKYECPFSFSISLLYRQISFSNLTCTII